MPLTPEEKARINIDKLLADCGWAVQDRTAANIKAGRGVAIRGFSALTDLDLMPGELAVFGFRLML